MTELADLTNHKIEGYLPDGRKIDLPLFSEITPDLWTGGCPTSITEGQFGGIINCYGLDYPIFGHVAYVEAPFADWGGEVPVRKIEYLAGVVNAWRKEMDKPVLVHCQAGLNRSNLVAALALVRDGVPAQEAIGLIRLKRSNLALCNKKFEEWLLTEA